MIARWSNLVKSPWLVGPILGLLTSRVLAESAPAPWRAVPLLLLVLGCVALGLIAVHLLHRVAPRLWPLGLLLVYVLWPWAWPALAGALALTAVSLLLMLHVSPRAEDRWPEALVLVGALGLYLFTLAPGVLPADSGEFQVVSGVLGIAHPPGYALYTLLGRLFTLLPVGSMAYRVNLFGAVCGALALAVITRCVRRGTGSTAAGLAAALALGLSATFWAQSTSANIRSLTALFTALCLALLLRWGALVRAGNTRAGDARAPRYLLALGVCFGLAVGHHSSLALLALPFLVYILLSAPGLLREPRRWAPALGGFAASFLVLLYLPIRSRMGAPFDPEPIRTWSDFFEHVLASGFRGDMFYFRSLPDLAARLDVWRNVMALQFGPLLPWIMLLAVWPVARRNPRALVLLGGTWAVNTLTALTYRAPQTVEYLLPSYVSLALLLGYGLGLALRRPAPAPTPAVALADGGMATDAVAARREGRAGSLSATGLQAVAQTLPVAVTVAVLLAAVWQGARNYPDFRALHMDRSMEEYVQGILSDAPQDALILANWHYATAFWYMQTVEGQRPDIDITYVYPEGSLPNEQVWLRRVEEALPQRPVLVTNWFYAYESTPYHWLPFHGAWLAQEEPLSAPPDYATAQVGEFDGPMRLLGYELDTENPAPGETVSLRVYWQPTDAWDRDYSAFVQLLGPDGVVGQGDIRHTSHEFAPGEVQVDAYRFPLLLHTPPGEYRLITGFYYTDDAGWHRLSVVGAPGTGDDHLELTRLTVRPADRALPTLHPTDQQFTGGLRLTGVDYDRGVSGQTRVYLHWQRDNSPPLPVGPWKSATGESVVARLWQAEGVVAQVALPALAPGAATTVALDVPADARDLRLDLLTPAGAPVARLGPWHRATAAAVRLRVPSGDLRYVPLGGEMAFVGLDDSPSTVAPGESVWLRPRFLALRPLVTDSTVSVGVRAADGSREIKQDGIPGLGGIPTLKWLGDWLVEDPHLLALPGDMPVGEGAITLQVYDAFTLEPLGVLDERLAREGQGTWLQVGPLRIGE